MDYKINDTNLTLYNSYDEYIPNNFFPNLDIVSEILTPKIILLSILTFLLVVTNGLLIFTILYHKHLRTKANYFVVALACSDFSLGFPSIPLHLMGEAGVFGKTQNSCLVVMCFSCTQIILSVLMLFALSLERYVKLVHPFSYAKYITNFRVLLCTMTCSIYSFIIGFLPLMGWNNADEEATRNLTYQQPCRFEIILSGSYMALVFLGHIGPTFIILPLLHFHIFMTAHKVLRRRSARSLGSETNLNRTVSKSFLDMIKMANLNTNSEKSSPVPNSPSSPFSRHSQMDNTFQTVGYHTKTSRNYRHFKILVLVGGYFIVSWIPLVIWECVLWEGFTKKKVTVYDLISSDMPMIFYYIALGLAIVNSAINPILFGMGNLTTRRAFIHTLIKCKKNHCHYENENSANSLVLIKDNIVLKTPIYKKHKNGFKTEPI